MDEKSLNKIKDKLKFLVDSIVDNGVIPFNELDIKSLKGDWKPYKRLRVGSIRIIFLIDLAENKIKIYDIDNRGNIY